jgi:hypothetical protein
MVAAEARFAAPKIANPTVVAAASRWSILISASVSAADDSASE